MKSSILRLRIVRTVIISGVGCAGCSTRIPSPDLARIYNQAAQGIGDERNPVIVIPGILGSKLEAPDNHKPIWGAWIYGAADPDTADGARLVALPMKEGVPLSELRDEIVATDVLDTLQIDIAVLRGVEFAAYVDILKTLAVGKYRDESLSKSGAVVDYAGAHYTCFQFAYDWRRDISEQAVALHERIVAAKKAAANARGSSRLGKVDVVAHSMGGLVLRYYLMYGPQSLPNDGTIPQLTWEGARNVENAILVGTPNAGSVFALRQLVSGVNYAALITPTYRPAVLGTMPSVYELMPRPRHARVVDAETGESIDQLDPQVWRKFEWGLADPKQDHVLQQLLPGVTSVDERRRIALDQLDKCLAKTKQLFAALDRPSSPPEGCSLHMIAGDAVETAEVLSVNPRTGRVSIASMGPGDGTVTRTSALMDERVGGAYQPRLRSPIDWRDVQFLSTDHLGLTRDPMFTNSVLYTLLEKPRATNQSPFQSSSTD